MKSKIDLTEKVENKDRKFGSALHYYPCHVEGKDGKVGNLLFTVDQIDEAMKRAEANPEDMPEKSFWEALIGE